MEQVFSLIQQYDFSILNYIWLYGHAHWLDIFMEEAFLCLGCEVICLTSMYGFEILVFLEVFGR